MKKMFAVVLGTVLLVMSRVTLADNQEMARPSSPGEGATESTVVKAATPPEVKAQEKREHELTPEQRAAAAKVEQGAKPPGTLADNPEMARPSSPEEGATEATVMKKATPPEVKTHEKQEHELTPEQAAAAAKVLLGVKPPETHVVPELQAAAARLAQQECALCHGRGGQSISPTFPRLAGQRAAYIQEELMEFREGSRRDPDAQAFMWGMASQLNNEIIEALGHYYEDLKPVVPEAADAKLSSAGKTLFEQGIPASGVPACQICHGPQAHGIGPLPRLAGQHVAYLVKQMRSFKNGLRANPVMEPMMQSLTSEQMQDVANYLQSIP